MKANRKFRQADEAVSPVIAVILMVAITVVLAATVFVLVSDIGGNTARTAPAISASTDDAVDKLVINSAATGADWNRMSLRVKSLGTATEIQVGGAAVPHQNVAGRTDAASAPLTTNTNTAVATASDVMDASDFVQFCSTTTTGANVVISLIDHTASQTIGDYTFPTILACT